jgi:hypothetical protein
MAAVRLRISAAKRITRLAILERQANTVERIGAMGMAVRSVLVRERIAMHGSRKGGARAAERSEMMAINSRRRHKSYKTCLSGRTTQRAWAWASSLA